MKRFTVVSFLILLHIPTIIAQSGTQKFILSAVPGIVIPTGEDSDIFNLSYAAALKGIFPIRFSDTLTGRPGIRLGYRYSPTNLGTPVSMIAVGGEAGLEWRFHRRFSAVATGGLGYFYAFLHDPEAIPVDVESGGGFFYFVEAGVSFFPSDSLSVGINTGWQGDLSYRNSITVGLDFSYRFHTRDSMTTTGEAEQVIEVSDIEIRTIFPVQYARYHDHPMGSAVLTNTSDYAIQDLSVEFFVSEFMSEPITLEAPINLNAGEQAALDIYGLFSKSLMDITQQTKVSGRITTDYRYEGRQVHQETTLILDIKNRNAITWDDDRKAAAFITPLDPAVLQFSKAVANAVRNEDRYLAEENTLYALGMYESLRLYGLGYVVDPTSSYKDISDSEGAVDYLQFPRQTLEYRAGDCDDMTVLYCALLESVGIETALITVPGHIFAAYAISDSYRNTSSALETVEYEGKQWVPVELTATDRDFRDATVAALISWKRNGDSSSLIPVHDAWNAYASVGLPGVVRDLDIPSGNDIAEVFDAALNRIVEQEVTAGISAIRRRYRDRPNAEAEENAIAIQYARYGRFDEAEEHFLAAIESGDSPKARINLGNLYLVRESWRRAIEWYETLEPPFNRKPSVLLGLARSYYELGNSGAVEEFYNRLNAESPELASRNAWLVDGTSAATRSGTGMEGGVIWED